MNSLGFEKDPSKTRVVVAMSGGVDSSVVAALLKDQGYDVVGITLQLYDHGEAVSCPTPSPSPERRTSKTCCAGADIYDARAVAASLGIPHYVLDYESAFRQSVIEDFADSYMKGETPIPCVRCNQRIKFRDLLATARDLGADCLATGHYVQRVMGASCAELHAGADPTRDQSYFLFATTGQQLAYLRFPLGHMAKTQTRELAHQYGLAVSDKPDSQDICFVPNGKYADVVARLRPGAIEPGEIVDESGTVLGQHSGIIHFTIGQRKGLNLQQREGTAREPLFVIGLDAGKKQVIVGPHERLARTQLILRETSWLTDDETAPLHAPGLTVKFRSAMPPVPCTVESTENGALSVHFEQPQFGVASGQAAVIYDGTRVLGGGWITG